MIDVITDVLIIGSGFGGSLTALILDRIGLSTLLVDRDSHPRFAIGESSTPAADLILSDLAQRYGLSELEPLTQYGTWRATYPELTCGLKRGFSYFHHRPGEEFEPHDDHRNELLVAASSNDDVSDTHWLRSDIDGFLAGRCESAGIVVLDQTTLRSIKRRHSWDIEGSRGGTPVRIHAQFLIDASGAGVALARHLKLKNDPDELTTRSHAVYGHFANVVPWSDVLRETGARLVDHPFCCDHAALHQILDDGWMWQLRFDNDIVSAGFVLSGKQPPESGRMDAGTVWTRCQQRYPSIARQFASAEIVDPPLGLQLTGRLQRFFERAAGDGWAALPNTAGFVDPLHSTGIAHTLAGIERICRILEECWSSDALTDRLAEYSDSIQAELRMIDRLVEGSYASFGRFPLMVSWSMLYFAAATTWEHNRSDRNTTAQSALFCADDLKFVRLIERLRAELDQALRTADATATRAFEDGVATAIGPWNVAGLCDRSVCNMYRSTAAPPR